MCQFDCQCVKIWPHGNFRMTKRRTIKLGDWVQWSKISPEFEGQGQRSKVTVTRDKKLKAVELSIARPYAVLSNGWYHCVPPGGDGLRRWENQRMLSSFVSVFFNLSPIPPRLKFRMVITTRTTINQITLFSRAEYEQVLSQINILKAPGPNWFLRSPSQCSTVLCSVLLIMFQSSRVLLPRFGSQLVPIPMVSPSRDPSRDLRHISWCVTVTCSHYFIALFQSSGIVCFCTVFTVYTCVLRNCEIMLS